MSVTLRGDKALKRKFRRMGSRSGVARIARRPLLNTMRKAEEIAARPGFGFTDRTGRLRSSLRLVYRRSGDQMRALLTANRYPGVFVEFKRRTLDSRPFEAGGYWLRRAVALAYRRERRDLQKDIRKSIQKEFRQR